jgi:hypothetical protein
VITSFIYPLRRFVNFLLNEEGNITYSGMWRLLRNFNIQGLNPTNASYFKIQSGKIELLLTKVAKYIHERNDPYSIPEEPQKSVSTLGALKGMLSAGNSSNSTPGVFGMPGGG